MVADLRVPHLGKSRNMGSVKFWGGEIEAKRGPPQFSRKRSENEGANENLSCGFPSIPGIAPGVALRIVAFVLLKS